MPRVAEILIRLVSEILRWFRLGQFASYYNDVHVHGARAENTPTEQPDLPSTRAADLQRFSWHAHRRRLFHTPIAA
jgi:hypothetical protein